MFARIAGAASQRSDSSGIKLGAKGILTPTIRVIQIGMKSEHPADGSKSTGCVIELLLCTFL